MRDVLIILRIEGALIMSCCRNSAHSLAGRDIGGGRRYQDIG